MPRIDDVEQTRRQQARELPILRYDPRREGLERWLGPLEGAIMAALWEERKPLRVKDIIRVLRENHDGQRAYTTIMTTCARLWKKAMLDRDWASGYVYSVRETREAFLRRQTDLICKSLDDELTRAIHSIAAGSSEVKADRQLLTPADLVALDDPGHTFAARKRNRIA